MALCRTVGVRISMVYRAFFFYMCEKKESGVNIFQEYINALLRGSIRQSSINLFTLSIVSILH